jgi:hypothetical protein
LLQRALQMQQNRQAQCIGEETRRACKKPADAGWSGPAAHEARGSVWLQMMLQMQPEQRS